MAQWQTVQARWLSADIRGGLPPAEAIPPREALDEGELRFVDNFDRLMRAAHYRRLSDDEWSAACDHDFTFTVRSIGSLQAVGRPCCPP
jgi:hypothetical protein